MYWSASPLRVPCTHKPSSGPAQAAGVHQPAQVLCGCVSEAASLGALPSSEGAEVWQSVSVVDLPAVRCSSLNANFI